jgi:hypothetical protein
MKITLSKDTSETLLIFGECGMRLTIRPRCQKCKKWVKITCIPNKRKKGDYL